MTILNKPLIWSLTIVSIFSYNIFAAENFSLSEVDESHLTRIGFQLVSLKDFEESSKTDFIRTLDVYCQNHNIQEDIRIVTNYPKAFEKTEVNYAPPRSTKEGTQDLVPFDTVIISRYFDPIQTKGEKSGPVITSNLAGVLVENIDFNWKDKGFSCHVILPINGGVIFYVDPFKSKGQMAGPWNAHSLEILAGTDMDHNLVPHQINKLEFIKDFSNIHGENIQILLSHNEARHSGIEGTIENIEEVREHLNFNKGEGKILSQIPLS